MLQSPFAFFRGTSVVMAADLARAHARSGAAAMIAGYMGSGRTFDEAICDFAVDYAGETEQDHEAFVQAVREGRVQARVES
jgi:hypothetical protein